MCPHLSEYLLLGDREDILELLEDWVQIPLQSLEIDDQYVPEINPHCYPINSYMLINQVGIVAFSLHLHFDCRQRNAKVVHLYIFSHVFFNL